MNLLLYRCSYFLIVYSARDIIWRKPIDGTAAELYYTHWLRVQRTFESNAEMLHHQFRCCRGACMGGRLGGGWMEQLWQLGSASCTPWRLSVLSNVHVCRPTCGIFRVRMLTNSSPINACMDCVLLIDCRNYQALMLIIIIYEDYENSVTYFLSRRSD